MESSSSSQQPNSSQQPPREGASQKLRSSCDACGVAKVKCDRSHPVCGRCVSLQISCTYSPSRLAGKMPRKRLRLEGDEDDTQQPSQNGPQMSLPPSMSHQALAPDQSMFGPHLESEVAVDSNSNPTVNNNADFTRQNSLPDIPYALFSDEDWSQISPFFTMPAHFSAPANPTAEAENQSENVNAPSDGNHTQQQPHTPHSCRLTAYEIFRDLVCPSPDHHEPAGSQEKVSIPAHTVLNGTRSAVTRLSGIFDCEHCRTTNSTSHQMMVLSSVISKILIWYQLVAKTDTPDEEAQTINSGFVVHWTDTEISTGHYVPSLDRQQHIRQMIRSLVVLNEMKKAEGVIVGFRDMDFGPSKRSPLTLSYQEPTTAPIDGITWRVVDYHNPDSLTKALQGIHTVLSFINQPAVSCVQTNAQIKLIDACVASGVKRFAPSEYGSVGKETLPFWQGKTTVASYLEMINSPSPSFSSSDHNSGKPVLEYTLFQPGLFLNYLATPHQTSKYITPLDTFISLEARRAIVVDGYEDTSFVTFTSSQDIARVVAFAVDYPDTKQWPKVGGIRGNRVSVAGLLQIAEKIHGGKFEVERVKLEDLERGELKTSWVLGRKHPSFSAEENEKLQQMFKTVMIGTLLGSVRGAWDVSDAWNKLLPEDFEFMGIGRFLERVWSGKV
ncbi:hypothetical protein QBC35DRAFT_389440 [Podospora australis]|uniref:Zn(2)-C6 fungal-type domain-containing protein n=1 Tax=Podospora australis TaxID=1536484 RepID=A0AAN6WS70_9PEZI|nr:hypothetical protein QBC35DRAFT_389440 [Podospora australis]